MAPEGISSARERIKGHFDMSDEGSMTIVHVCYLFFVCLACCFDRMFGATGPGRGSSKDRKTRQLILSDRARTKSRFLSFRAGAMHGNTQKRGRRGSHA